MRNNFIFLGTYSFSTLLAAPAFLLFLMMLFVPTVYQPVKAVLLILVLGMIAIRTLLHRRLPLHPAIVLWTLLIVTTGLTFMFIGLVNGAPGALRVGTIYVLWPLTFTFLLAGSSKKWVIDGLIRILVLATIAIGLYAASYILHTLGWLPDAFYIEIDLGQKVGLYRGTMEFGMYSTSSLLFLVPFLFGALLTWPKDVDAPIPRYVLWFSFLLSLILVLLSGRRALWLIVGCSPIIALIFRTFLPREHKQANKKMVWHVLSGFALILFFLFVYLHYKFGLDIQAMATSFASGFNFAGDPSASVRKEQFYALLKGWSQNPVIGNGLGAFVKDCIRSVEIPWAYELSYIALLFHTGMLGFLIYFSAVAWIFWMGLRIIRSGNRLGLYMLPVLVGTSTFLIGNATNPYLGKFDYMWVIFLPLALINYWLVNGRERDT